MSDAARLAMVATALAAGLVAQGTPPKPKAAEYPAHAAAGQVEFGAEYLVHSFSGEGQTYTAPRYLVVEVALYPAPETTLAVNAGEFTLRLNGAKRAVLPQSPGMVAGSLKYPDWETPRGVEASAGAGGADVILGRPPVTERFPGDPRPRQQRLPQPPQAPTTEARPAGVPAYELVERSALPEGPARQPVSGYLYFAYPGKVEKLKSVVLLYQGIELKLR